MLLQMAVFHSLLCLSNIPLCVCVYVCMYIHVCVYIYVFVHIHHIFLSQLSVHGYFSCFHVLAVVNSAAVNIGVHVSFQIRVFLFSRNIPRSGIAGSYGSAIFSF